MEEKKSVGIAFIWNNQILLTSHPAEDDFVGTLSIPKGRPNEGEVDMLTAKREIKEEINIDVPIYWLTNAQSGSVFTDSGREIVYYIVPIENLVSELGMDEGKTVINPRNYQLEEINWSGFMPFDMAWENMLPYQRDILIQAGYTPPAPDDTESHFDGGGEAEKYSYKQKGVYNEETVRVQAEYEETIVGNAEKVIEIPLSVWKEYLKTGELNPEIDWEIKSDLSSISEGRHVDRQSLTLKKLDKKNPINSSNDNLEDGGVIEEQLHSEAFKNWFKKSKVVDSKGNPLIVYHGTSSDANITEFKASSDASKRKGLHHGFDGIFFTNDLDNAGWYSEIAQQVSDSDEEYGVVMKLYLSMQKPYYLDLEEEFYPMAEWGVDKLNLFRETLINNGFDGIIVHQIHEGEETEYKEYIVFNPNQIKSATENSGNFSVTNPDITAEDGGVIEGQLHTECNDETGCGEKFTVGDGERVIEAERDEAVLVASAFNNNILCPDDTCIYEAEGTPSQIASAINVMGGGMNFDKGAIIKDEDGKVVELPKMKSEEQDTDVDRHIESGSIIINRRSMAMTEPMKVKGTLRQIASAINSINGNGVVIEQGASVKQ